MSDLSVLRLWYDELDDALRDELPNGELLSRIGSLVDDLDVLVTDTLSGPYGDMDTVREGLLDDMSLLLTDIASTLDRILVVMGDRSGPVASRRIMSSVSDSLRPMLEKVVGLMDSGWWEDSHPALMDLFDSAPALGAGPDVMDALREATFCLEEGLRGDSDSAYDDLLNAKDILVDVLEGLPSPSIGTKAELKPDVYRDVVRSVRNLAMRDWFSPVVQLRNRLNHLDFGSLATDHVEGLTFDVEGRNFDFLPLMFGAAEAMVTAVKWYVQYIDSLVVAYGGDSDEVMSLVDSVASLAAVLADSGLSPSATQAFDRGYSRVYSGGPVDGRMVDEAFGTPFRIWEGDLPKLVFRFRGSESARSASEYLESLCEFVNDYDALVGRVDGPARSLTSSAGFDRELEVEVANARNDIGYLRRHLREYSWGRFLSLLTDVGDRITTLDSRFVPVLPASRRADAEERMEEARDCLARLAEIAGVPAGASGLPYEIVEFTSPRMTAELLDEAEGLIDGLEACVASLLSFSVRP